MTLWDGRLHPESALEHALDEGERDEALRFPRPRDRALYVAARTTLRSILAYHLDVPPGSLRFGYAAEGKPHLSDYPELRFNLSHAGHRFLLGVSREAPLGVDLEKIPDERVVAETARRVLSAPEQEMLDGLPGPARAEWFAAIWTRKEACVKADGRGLSVELNRLDVATALPRVLVCETTRGGWTALPRWTVRSIHLEAGYAAAVAAEGEGWRVERLRWPREVTLGG